MANPRKSKTNHLIPADRVGSKAKAGVWFAEKQSFQTIQGGIMDRVKDKIDWINLDNAVMAISDEPTGIVVIAPNPSLPGIIVLADGATQKDTEELQQKYSKIVSGITSDMSIDSYIGGLCDGKNS